MSDLIDRQETIEVLKRWRESIPVSYCGAIVEVEK